MARDFREEMEALRRQYLHDARAKIDYLAAAARGLAGFGGPASTRPDLEELRRTVHRLAGSAGLYGLAAVGEKAREVDELLVRVLREGAAPDGPRIASSLSELVQALQEATRDEVTRPQETAGPGRRGGPGGPPPASRPPPGGAAP
ncbi:Hpt domain-containing protein [Caldinitratiruptor microaerophilus]|uniref:HPt domain-containing protein n=1 Tax=Caldinitratiruptor microaerophilus TaxID=671077 RepID=A0AA35CPH3_9FIRM|nr:Hpt domain-containing protein [Caldinitratiruptor microaerophilus]BDG61360.1 hypothetical protein caldi_24500 [Caldinitratiruptor microaerophilus]